MKTHKVSIEYCHLDPALDFKQQVISANKYTASFLRAYDRGDVQMCMMVDDLHSSTLLDNKKIESVIDDLDVKPDSVYLESSFVFLGSALVQRLSSDRMFLRNNGERQWLRTVREGYGSVNEFLVAWQKKPERISFACPTLVAVSYLYRLGVIRDDRIEPVMGERMVSEQMIVNMLESKYMQVEENARELMKTAYPNLSIKAHWHFY